MGIREQTIFMLYGSLVDQINKTIPNFQRSSPVNIEREINNEYRLELIPGYRPAFFSESGAFMIEPDGVNLITWNTKLTNPVWQKGSSVNIREDAVLGLDNSSRLADRVTWIGGSGNSQLLQYEAELEPGGVYTLSLYLKLVGNSTFGKNDVIRIQGEVSDVLDYQTKQSKGKPVFNLTELNNYKDRYKLCTMKFAVSGVYPKNVPNNYKHENPAVKGYEIFNIQPNAVSIKGMFLITQGELVGSKISFSNAPNTFYTIASNTDPDISGNLVITVEETVNFLAIGVNSSVKLLFSLPSKKNIIIQFYCESTATVDWAGIQLEEGPFRTSMIFQEKEKKVRSATRLSYETSPTEGLKTFGVFVELQAWRGAGTVLDAGNFNIWFDERNRLTVQFNEVIIVCPDMLPWDTPLSFYVQVSEEAATASVYIDGILKAKTAINNFKGLPALLILSSLGFRVFKKIFFTDKAFQDGQVAVGAAATQEVAEIFADKQNVRPRDLADDFAFIVLAPTLVPPSPSGFGSKIRTINNVDGSVVVDDNSGFTANSSVAIMRGDGNDSRLIAYRVIRNIGAMDATTGGNMILDSGAGISPGDFIIIEAAQKVGQAFARFPFTPIDYLYEITAIDVANNRLSVLSVLSFSTGRAIVQTSSYQAVTEVLIKSINKTTNTLDVHSVTGIKVGDIIAQSSSEVKIDPPNYTVELAEKIYGVGISARSRNGVLIKNITHKPATVTPIIRVAL